MEKWEKKVLATPGAAERVAQNEEELRLAAGLTSLREQAGLSQRELAERIGVRQPRIAAIERSRNVTIEVLERYIGALGGQLEVSVIRGGKKIALLTGRHAAPTTAARSGTRTAPAKKTSANKAATAKGAGNGVSTDKTSTGAAHGKAAARAKRTTERGGSQARTAQRS
jgi:transcriptional regulator with XRE-family HTH domain